VTAPPASSGSWADELYARLAPIAYADGDNGWALLHFCSSLGTMFQPIRDLVRDSDDGPGWSALLDIDRCPDSYLGYLAQLHGVSLLPQLAGQSDADYATEMRDWIKRADGLNRGSADAIKAAAERRLTGTKFVEVIERDQDPYALTVVTRVTETPDPAGTYQDALSQKPAGLWPFQVITADLPVWQEGDVTWDSVAAGVTWNSATTSDV
jgi:Phage tail protein (Tail_P2_I)